MLGPNVTTLSDLFGMINIRKLRHSRHEFRRIADLTSFHGFFAFQILEDVNVQNLNLSEDMNLRPRHKI